MRKEYTKRDEINSGDLIFDNLEELETDALSSFSMEAAECGQ